MTNIEQQAREEFEKWISEEYPHWSMRKVAGEYALDAVSDMWEPWKASWNRRALSAPDNAEAVCPNCDRLTEIRHCQACGCDFTSLTTTTSTADNAEAVDLLAGVKRYSHELVGSYIHWEVRAHESPQGEWCRYSDVWAHVSLPLVDANPTPAARVSVSDEDLTTVEAAARYFERTGKAVSYVAAIYRLVQAVKGEKL